MSNSSKNQFHATDTFPKSDNVSLYSEKLSFYLNKIGRLRHEKTRHMGRTVYKRLASCYVKADVEVSYLTWKQG